MVHGGTWGERWRVNSIAADLLILDGILVLDALEQIGRKANFVTFVSGGASQSSYASQILAYWSRRDLPASADSVINGYVET